MKIVNRKLEDYMKPKEVGAPLLNKSQARAIMDNEINAALYLSLPLDLRRKIANMFEDRRLRSSRRSRRGARRRGSKRRGSKRRGTKI